MTSIPQQSSILSSQVALLNALRENFKNDYPQNLSTSTIGRIRSFFKQIITSPLEQQKQKCEQLLRKNKDLSHEIEFGLRRLKKYTYSSPVTEEIIIQKPSYGSISEQSLTDYDHLISNRNVLLDNKRVEFRKGTYLGDGKTRAFQQYKQNPRLFELSKSIWVAEKTPKEQYVWRARVMADKDDVYKLLKFLATPLSSNVSRFPFQSIHINAGCHGIEGKGAYELAKPKLSDQRVYSETLENIFLLKKNDERIFSSVQLEDISIARTGTLTPCIYPDQADHIIDTLCEGAKYKAEGNGLKQPLMFLYDEQQAAEQIQKVAELKTGTIPRIAFGKADWERYVGKVEEELPLPPNMEEILQGPCPIWKGKRVIDTHLLTLIPKTVDGNPLTLNSLEKLIQKPKGGGHATKYRHYSDYVKPLGDNSSSQSYWALMTKDVLPDSRYKTYSNQYELVKNFKKRTGINYELPPILGGVVSILMHYVKTGERFYSDNPRTYTRCQEMDKNNYPVAIGRFSADGLAINDFNYGHGVAGFRKFY